MQRGILFLLWDKSCSLVPVVNFSVFTGICYLEKWLEKDSTGKLLPSSPLKDGFLEAIKAGFSDVWL